MLTYWRCWAQSGTSLLVTPALSASLWQGPDVMAFCICSVILLFFPSLLWWGEISAACPLSTTKRANIYSFLVFSSLFFPTQDHLSVCHPRNKTKGQTQRAAWIIACPQLEKHGMQLFSSHLHNRPRNTERSPKLFHCLCWVLMIRQYIWAHQTQLTSPDKLVFELKNIKQENSREQTTALFSSPVPVTLTPYGVCNENGI